MNKKENGKENTLLKNAKNGRIDFSVKQFKEGELPPLIRDGELWSLLNEKLEVQIFYKTYFNNVDPLMKHSQSHVKGLLNYPESKINQAYLEGARANPAKWHYNVNILNYCLEQTLTEIMQNAYEGIKKIEYRMKQFAPFYELINK